MRRIRSATARAALLGVSTLFAVPLAAGLPVTPAYARATPDSFADLAARLLPAVGELSAAPVRAYLSEIAGLAFSGRDTAAGKSFDAWVKKYWEKKAAGEKGIGIEAEKLD